jgi:GAF domain-containing protein/anti-sigma regulatory factor (Ser/Thr protein kinase)
MRSTADRYGIALLATAAGLLGVLALLGLSSEPIYAPLMGAVLLSVWLAGIGPAAASLVIGWTLALWVGVEPRYSFTGGDRGDVARWAINLALALLILVVAALLRLGRERAKVAASEAESSLGRVGALHQLAAELAGAASSAEVSQALARRAAALLDAQWAAFGLLERDGVLTVDPIGSGAILHVPGRRVSLDAKTVLSAAVREDRIVRARDRALLEREYPDSATALPDTVRSAVALPLHAAGRPVGVVEFLFDRPDAIDDELAAVASTAAGLAELALERTRLYERERELRASLERILQVAPRFYTEPAEEVTSVICREARTAFGADYGVLWRIRDDVLELVRSDPVREEWPQGLQVALADFPGLESAVETLGVSFVPDVLAEARGGGLERVRQLGIRSSLRSPIAVGGDAELVLVVSWQTVIDEPDGATIAIVRRFADQAGLALEQLERRRAEERAAARAAERERLQEVSAALSKAATRGEVGETCVTHALRLVGAEAGFVVLTGAGGASVQMLSTSGYSEEAIAAWAELGLDADVPFARAITSGEPVWALTREEMSAFTAAPPLEDAGWVSIPLRTPAGIHGALHVSLHEPRDLSESERSLLQTIVSQCAVALERSKLYDEEQLLRARSERLQRTIAQLSNAVTQAEVAEVVVESAIEGTSADSAHLFDVSEERQVARRLATRGLDPYGDAAAELSLDEDSPIARAARRRTGWWHEPDADSLFDGASAVVPLVSGRRTVGVLELAWNAPVVLEDDDRALLQTLTSQGAQALDRARLFESERSIAETLQRSVLPVALPRLEGVQIAARYLPGTQEVDVGGDWFDAVELPDERLGLAVGDVVGKGVHAAASMGQLRNALRAISIERLKPQSALARLDRLAGEALDTSFATVVYGVVDTKTGVLRFASAGHPPPAVAYPDGRVELLEDGRGLPLGTGLSPKYRQGMVELPAGALVVLYTDGLVERRGRTIDEGLERLVSAIETAPKDSERMLEHVLDELVVGSERADDIAILAARFLPVAPRPLDLTVRAGDDALHLVRDAVRTWLEGTELVRTEAEDVLLAVWEVCANAMEHAATPLEDTVRVKASVDDSRIKVVVGDTGSFVPVATRPHRGLGLQLAERLASSVDVTLTEAGTTVALEKRLPEGAGPA